MSTEILQGVPSLLKVCKDPLPEYDNCDFERVSPIDLYLPLGPTQLSSGPNNSIKNKYVCGFPLYYGV